MTNLTRGKKGPLQVNSIKRAASNLWLQIAVVAALAIVVGGLLSPISPFGREASASDFSADQSQRDITADGVVTQGEYTSAINRTLACVRTAGGGVIQQRFEDYRNVPVWNFVISEPNAKPGSPSAYDVCWMKFSRNVESVWVQQESAKITPEKRAADAKKALACAVEENLGVSTIDELRELDRSGQRVNGDVGRCITIANEGFDLDEHPPIIIN